jgi:hypothetical protein
MEERPGSWVRRLICIYTYPFECRRKKRSEQPSSEGIAIYAFGGYGEECHSSALQLACRTPKHTSQVVVSLHASRRVESESILSVQSRLSGYRNSTPAMIDALAALAGSMSCVIRRCALPSCNISRACSRACSLGSTCRHPCFRIRGIRGWSDMYQIGCVL